MKFCCLFVYLIAGITLTSIDAYITTHSTHLFPSCTTRRCWLGSTTRRRWLGRSGSQESKTITFSSTTSEPSSEATTLKDSLLSSIKTLRTLQERDGDISIDFGVKGGELNNETRAPQKVDYYKISNDVGVAADNVLQICNDLSRNSPIDEPTAFLGNKANGSLSPLNGAWKLLFTTAADASFSKNSTRGAASAQNIVDASKGKITNVIDFATKDDGTEPVLKQLNVIIKATAASAKRVELQFKYAKAVLTKFFFFPLFGKRLAIYIPVPGPFITRCIVFISRLLRFGRKKDIKKIPKAYFDIMYLDKDLRIHKTGEDNMFVQARESWKEAKPLLE